MTALSPARRGPTVFAAGAVIGLFVVILAFGFGFGAGMIAHRLNELNHGGCVATYEGGL